MRTLSFLLVILLSACASTPPAPAGASPGKSAVRRAHRAGRHRRRAQGERGDAPLSRGRHLRPDPHQGAQAGLVDALYRRAQLKLEYDAATTKTAAEAFDARSGNCLSLVLMTAALAHELQLPVRYQSAYMEEAWSRNGNPAVRQRPRQHHPSAGACSMPATIARLQPLDDRLPAGRRDPHPARARHRREHRAGDVRQQPRRRGAGARQARRRLRLGGRGDAQGPRRS